jgi:CheY-like chemotaxis protein
MRSPCQTYLAVEPNDCLIISTRDMNDFSRPKSEARQQKALIYVVDDEPMLLELATVVLEPLGYEIEIFRDPQAALRSYASVSRRPALIITDYAMHSMNGLELVSACRSLQPDQKILLLSGTVDEQTYENERVKPDRFLSKPYQARQLIEAVESLIPNKL